MVGIIIDRHRYVDHKVLSFHYYNKDHLGNIREVVNENGSLEEINNYYPFGMPYYEGKAAQKFTEYQLCKYNGKELDRLSGLNTYDHGARQNYATLGVWDRIDPMAEKYYRVSAYAVCGNNPIIYTDHNGKLYGDYITGEGTYLGSDGKDDGKLYVLKMSNSEYVESYDNAKINGIRSKDRKRIIKSKDISDKNNFVEIDGNYETRNNVTSKIEDDGSGGTNPNNNREYLITFMRGDEVPTVYVQKGEVEDPTKQQTISVRCGASPNVVHIHTHPSGMKDNKHWMSGPSKTDIQNATSTSYVISLYNNKVYIYDSTGILASMSLITYKEYGKKR